MSIAETAPGAPRAAERPAAAYPPKRARWVAMGVLLVAGFMNLIDVTIVNVALPSMREALGATEAQIEWVVAVYILTFALLLLPGGRYGDILGKRRVFVAGIVVFTIGSALCGLAPSIEVLVGARVAQAVGGAMMIPQTLALVPSLFPPRDRGAAFAVFGLSAGLASVTGPLLGGVLIGADLWGLGWRPIFLVNIPVGVAAVLLALRYLPRTGRRADMGQDFIGVGLAGAALLLLVFPLIEGRALGWPLWCFLAMIASVPAALAFVLWQRRQAARGGAQLLPASLLANRTYLLGTLMAAVLFSGMPGFFLVMALFLQSGFGLTPLQSGLTTVPFSVGVLIASFIAGRLGNRWPRPRVTAGGGAMALAMTWLTFVIAGTGDEIVRTEYWPPLLLAGLGLGTAVSPLFNTILAAVPERDTGSGSGALQAFQQVGGAFGVAIVAQIFFSSLNGSLAGGMAPHPAYEGAFILALTYVICAYGALAGMAWLLPPPGALSRAAPPASG